MDVIDPEKFAEENPNSIFRLTNVALMNPGVCFICNSSGGDGRQFIETGKSMDYFGVVYWCTFCLEELARLLGFDLKANWELAEKNLQAEVSVGDDRWIQAQEEIRAARILLRNCHCDSTPDVVNDSGDVQVADEPASETEPVLPDESESDGVEGSDDISESSNDSEMVDGDAAPKSRGRARKSAE